MITCPACGTQSSPRDRFCRHCGTRLKGKRATTIFYRMLALFVGVLGMATFMTAIRSDRLWEYPIGAACLLVGLVFASFVTWIR